MNPLRRTRWLGLVPGVLSACGSAHSPPAPSSEVVPACAPDEYILGDACALLVIGAPDGSRPDGTSADALDEGDTTDTRSIDVATDGGGGGGESDVSAAADEGSAAPADAPNDADLDGAADADAGNG